MKEYKKPSVFSESVVMSANIIPVTMSAPVAFASGVALALAASKKGDNIINGKVIPLRKVEVCA